MLVLICSRFNTPRTVGEIPTAVYASIAFAMSPPTLPNEVAADDSTHKGGKKGEHKEAIEKREIRINRQKGKWNTLYFSLPLSPFPFSPFSPFAQYDSNTTRN